MAKIHSPYDPNHCYLWPEAWPQFILRLLPFWRIFNYSAHLHDLFFHKGWTVKEFDMANRIFCTMTVAASKTKWQSVFAVAYGYAVCRFGKYFFKWKESI